MLKGDFPRGDIKIMKNAYFCFYFGAICKLLHIFEAIFSLEHT